MKKPTAKQLALKINPNLFGEKNKNRDVVIRDKDRIYATAHFPQQAWHDAYHTLASEQFKVGDQLVMIDCFEAKKYKDRVWTCRHQSYLASSGDYWVFLEGFSGSFICEYLRHATAEEIQAWQEVQSLQVLN